MDTHENKFLQVSTLQTLLQRHPFSAVNLLLVPSSHPQAESKLLQRPGPEGEEYIEHTGVSVGLAGLTGPVLV